MRSSVAPPPRSTTSTRRTPATCRHGRRASGTMGRRTPSIAALSSRWSGSTRPEARPALVPRLTVPVGCLSQLVDPQGACWKCAPVEPRTDQVFQELGGRNSRPTPLGAAGTRLALYRAGYVEVVTMHALNRLKSRPAEAGFTLAEILVACAIISVGLVAVATGFGFGVDGVEAGRQQSTAVFLAEQRLEQAKELAMRQTGLVQLTVANLPATEAYG